MDNNEEIDLTLAIQMQARFEEELRIAREKQHNQENNNTSVFKNPIKPTANNRKNNANNEEKLAVPLVDPSWEMIDPTPNIHDLFITFNQQFFWGTLHAVEVKWSPRMTLCAGVCSYEGRGGLCSVRLSVPLLKLRPRKDLVETLLHEMIHAYLFVADRDRDRDGHGPKFHEHMYRINRIAGTNITVYHSFHDEVKAYRQHVWQCDGPCRHRPPYYGLVKRSMNRPPSPRDLWWSRHLHSCGGSYTKIQEPEGYGTKKRKLTSKSESNKKMGDITKYISTKNKTSKDPGSSSTSNTNTNKSINGLNTANNGTVNAINVNHASNANVHGFKKNVSNVSDKSKASNNTTNSIKKGGLTKEGSSNTIVVNGKKDASKSEDTINGLNLDTFNPFSGTGYSLGTNSSSTGNKPGVSRLLSLNNDNLRKSVKSSNKVKSKKTTTPCPLCNIVIEVNDMDNHLSKCIGDLDDDFEEIDSFSEDFQDKTNNTIDNSNNSMNSSIVVLDNHDKISQKHSTPQTSQPPVIIIEDKYPCPVCNEQMEESLINQHLDDHFKS